MRRHGLFDAVPHCNNRPMTDQELTPNQIEYLSWKVMAGILERIDGELFLADLHPGGGQYDCLSLVSSDPEIVLMLNDRFRKAEKLNSIKLDLAYQLSSLVEKASTKLAISEMATEFPTLCLRMKKPAKKNDFDAIAASISSFCEGL